MLWPLGAAGGLGRRAECTRWSARVADLTGGGEVRKGGSAGGGLAALGAVGPGAWLMAVHLAAGVAVFWYGIASLVDAWQTPEYSHGPIIPLLSLFMYLREMKSVPPTERAVTDRWPGVVAVVLALALGVVGLLVRIPDLVTYALILWIGGTIAICYGLRRGWYFWPSVLHLVFMLPLPQFLYWPLSIWLQGVSSVIGVELIQMAGVPVFLDGNVIDLGVYKLLVAEACSGLRYLFPVMSFSYVFSILYTGPLWHKAVLLLSAAPITVLMNSFRIGVIGVMVDQVGIGWAEGFLHAFEGWVIFIACVLILFALAALMQRLGPDPRPLGESIDLDFDGIPQQAARFARIAATPALVAATALTATSAVAWHLAPERRAAEIERTPLALFPRRIDDWSGTRSVLPTAIEDVLAADDYLSVSFAAPGEPAPIDLFVAYYDSQTEGSGIHSPEVCIPQGGWEVSRWQRTTIDVSGAVTGGDTLIEANRAVIQKGLSRQIVIYWFEQRGRRLASDYEAKALTVWDSLTEGRSDGALVRLITPILQGESEDEAEARLKGFIPDAMRRLAEHVPS